MQKADKGDFERGSNAKIVILQRGWVFIGIFSQEGDRCLLKNAYNIRTWGTTKGLGELAEEGPKQNTRLDEVNDVQFHVLTSIAVMDANDVAWEKTLYKLP